MILISLISSYSFREGTHFEADFLPDSLIATIPNRCEPKFRNV